MKILFGNFTIFNTVVAILFFIKFLNPVFNDPDFYWHLKTGEYIVSHMTVPTSDPFAYTSMGKTWVAHEWLSEVVFYFVADLFGLSGIKVLVASLFTITFIVLFRFSKKMVQNEIRALIISLIFFAPLMPYGSPRPQVFTFLLFSVLLCILLDFKYFNNAKRLIAIPLLMPLWVNLHGAYAVGFMLLLMFLCTEWVMHLLTDKQNILTRNKLRRLSFITIASVVTANINPHFLDVWTYPFYLVSLEVSKGVIAEWRSPDFHLTFYKYYLLLIIIYFLALAYSRKKPDLTEHSIPLFFICCGLVSLRHLPLTCFVLLSSISVLYRYLDLPKAWLSIFRKPKEIKSSTSKELSSSTISMLNIGLIISVTVSALYIDASGKNERAINNMLPLKATDYIIQNHIVGNMLNDYDYGGYLIYRLAPNRKVFIDGRADMYGDEFVKEYLAIYNGAANWKELFDKHSIDYVVCKRDAAIRQLLLTEKTFKEVFADEVHSILVRDRIKANVMHTESSQYNGNSNEQYMKKTLKPGGSER